jgi:hypothetical protein
MILAKRRVLHAPVAALILLMPLAALALQAGSSIAAPQETDAAAPQAANDTAPAAEAEAAAPDEKLAQQITGLWRLDGRISADGLVTDVSDDVLAIKHIVAGHWNVTYYAVATGVVRFHHGGTYTLKDGEYAESLKYANQNTATMIGQTNRFDIHIEDDTLTNQGKGNSYNEVWKRVKAEDR